jgi:hypothetical protein
MRGAPLRAAAAAALAAALLLGLPSAAAATIEGGCVVTGTSTSGGVIDLTTASVWHVRASDEIAVTGSAPFEQFHGDASAYAFGFAIPLASGESKGEMSFESDTYQVSTLALLGRVFVIAGSSSSAFHGCAGTVEIVIDDANPFMTLLGGGGLAAIGLGLLGLLWALWRPTSARRRIVGLLALALFGAGLGLVLQQTAAPGEAVGPQASAWVSSVAGPAQVSLDPLVLVQSAALAALVIVLMPFPATLFNKTLEANLDEIRSALRRIPVLGRLVAGPAVAPGTERQAASWQHPLAIAAFVAASALLYGLLDPAFGPDLPSFFAFLGIVAALLGVRWIGGLPKRAMMASLTGDRGRLRAIPWTILIAAACVVVSRLAAFLPGYLYGLVLGYRFTGKLEPRHEGRVGAAAGWWMLAIALVAWFCLGSVRTPGIEPSVPATLAASVFAGLVVGGIQGVAFGYLPVRFLPGEATFRWHRGHWALLYALGLFAFFWIMLNPAHGFVSATPPSSLVTTIALFVAFGLASVLFWAFFRFRRRSARPPV